jgi:23S rRNA (uridine2552-2'-O)-methyltransferase
MSKFVVRDTFFRKAKQDGYRARSAYKLKEIQDKFHFIKKNDKVLDLGCAPGSFLQVLSELVGDQGKVIGIDILPVAALASKNIVTMIVDIRDADVSTILQGLSMDHVDVVTCDIAPNMSGIREVDDKNVTELSQAVLDVVSKGLKPGGKFLIKSFFSENLKEMDTRLKGLFTKVALYKPAASRRVSSEIYFVCLGKKQGSPRSDDRA